MRRRRAVVIGCIAVLGLVLVLYLGFRPEPGRALWTSDFGAEAANRPVARASAFEDTPWNLQGGGAIRLRSDPERGVVMEALATPAAPDAGEVQRAERVPRVRFREGDTAWIGFDFRVDGELGVAGSWQGMFQLKTGGNADVYPPVAVNVNERSEGLKLLANGVRPFDLGPAPRDRWTRIVLGIHMSQDPSTAWVEAWRDGRQVVERTDGWGFRNADGTLGGTIARGGNGVDYLKFGVYRGAQPFGIQLAYADLIVGTTRAVVE